MMRLAFLLASLALGCCGASAQYSESPMLAAEVAAGRLPPLAQRLPRTPLVLEVPRKGWKPGKHGGEVRTLMARDRDMRMFAVYGYARLVGYDERLVLAPDVLRALDNVDNRVFTLHLRPGHKWSDGKPFTSEDFRYYWEDVANNKELAPFGLPQALVVRGRGPKFEVIDETTVRYSWDEPNPQFITALAGPSPLYIFRPAHYLRQFHARYVGVEKGNAQAKAAGSRNWAGLHAKRDEQIRFDNPDLPTLEPWFNTIAPPSTRFVLHRNPYFHRVDRDGRQLPYIDRIVVGITDDKLIPAKTGSGESDLQGRYLRFDNYTFLKRGAQRNDYRVLLWEKALGSQMALFPNLNVEDPEWRKLMRDVRFRRALSLAINRHEINEVVYFGLGRMSANTVLARSPLFKDAYRNAWIRHSPKEANALLDAIGLTRRNDAGLRLLPDGRPMELIVDTAGESTEETDVLELIRDSWRQVGIALFARPSQREVFRKRVYSGKSMMSTWTGLANGVPTPEMSPAELAPTMQEHLQWPMWGQYYEQGRKGGEAPTLPEAQELVQLYEAWRAADTSAERERAWHAMLAIHAEQVFTIGIVTRALQPLVVRNNLRNVPTEGIWNWDPGAYFGIYRPDTFWIDAEAQP